MATWCISVNDRVTTQLLLVGTRFHRSSDIDQLFVCIALQGSPTHNPTCVAMTPFRYERQAKNTLVNERIPPIPCDPEAAVENFTSGARLETFRGRHTKMDFVVIEQGFHMTWEIGQDCFSPYSWILIRISQV